MDVDRVEPKGIVNGEQSFLVVANGDPGLVLWNKEKDLSRCDTCGSGKCEHTDLLDTYLSVEIKTDWMNIIKNVYYDFNTTKWRALWLMLTDGVISPGHPLRKAIRDYHHTVIMPLYNEHGLGMTIGVGDPGDREPDGTSKAIKKRWRTDPALKDAYKEYERLKQEWEDTMIANLNFHLSQMTIEEVALIQAMFIPEEIKNLDWDLLLPIWHNAQDWADENSLLARLLTSENPFGGESANEKLYIP